MPRLLAASALVLAAVVAVPSVAAAAADGATIDKTGWWNRANTPTATPAGPVTVPPPPGIPEGDLTVGRLGDEATAIAAVGIQPDEGPGATVESFTLTLREDPAARANRNAADATIVACPITSFWAGGENGAWETAPEHDCDAASAPGERAEDGTWTFDLAAVGALWFDTFGTIRADGVALVPDPDADPSSFQVVWLGGEEDIDVALRATPGPAGDDPFASPIPADPPSDAGLSSGPGGGSASLFSPPQIATPPALPPSAPVDLDAGVDADERPTAADVTETAAPAARALPRPSRAGEIVGNWPPAAFLFVPVALALLAATSYWLGPAGQPATVDRRGGVSRALAVRTRTSQER
jgi:hypothetical protein